MPGAIATIPRLRFTGATGAPLAGGLLTTYLTGTTTKTPTYQDQAMTIANTNPIVLDGNGTCVVWLNSALTYKIVLTDQNGVSQWTQSNIVGGGVDASFELSLASLTAALATAQASATAAAASRTAIDNRIYPGTYAVAPTTRPDGTAIQDGNEYSGTDGFRYARIAGVWVNQTAAAAGSASTASAQAGISTAQAGLATTAKTAAEAARDLANTYAQASQSAAGIYDSVTLGRAASASTTGPTSFFQVKKGGLDNDGVTLLARQTMYQRTGVSTQTLLYTILPAAEFDGIIDSVQDLSGDPLTILDAASKVALRITADGTLLAKLGLSIGTANGLVLTRNADNTYALSLGTVAGQFTSALGGMVDLNSETLDDLLTVVDSANKVAFGIRRDGTAYGKIASDEVTAARGTRTSLTTRIDQHLTPYGMPKRHQWGEWYTRETRQRLRKRLLAEAAQLVAAGMGDSWNHAVSRWTGPTASTLKTTYGDAGPGWTGFAWGFGGLSNAWAGGNGNVTGNNIAPGPGIIPSDVQVSLSANWTVLYGSSASPDIGHIFSSTAGSKVTVAYGALGNTSAVNLFYIAGAGAIQYRWNAGSWTALDLSAGSGLTVATLASMPTGTWTLDIENVSGTTTICGLDIQKTTDGVRWHKLGATGSTAANWVSPNAAQWQAGLTALAPNLVTIMLATNDQAAYDSATYKTHTQTLITRVRAAVPLADIVLICPCENGRVNTRPMTDYETVLYELAATNKCGFIGLQYVFGETFSEYASTSPRAWFNADLIHPEPSTGGRVIVDAVTRFLTA